MNDLETGFDLYIEHKFHTSYLSNCSSCAKEWAKIKNSAKGFREVRETPSWVEEARFENYLTNDRS